MSPMEDRLRILIRERGYQQGIYRLASGGISDYYVDLKPLSASAEGAFLIGEVLYEKVAPYAIDAAGGLAMGAIPLTISLAISYWARGKPLSGCWVRQEVKDHGTQKSIEGNVKPGNRVMLLEDVTTKGTSLLKAAEALRGMGCEIVGAVVLVDRLQGARDMLRERQIRLTSVFTVEDLKGDSEG